MMKIKDWLMPLSMLIGAIFHEKLAPFGGLTAILIFIMLFFTFNKLSPKSIGLHRLHAILLGFQLVFSVGLYFLIRPYNEILAQGVMICIFAPSASASAVITHMLGGDMAFVTTYTMIANLMVALLSPMLFSYMYDVGNVDFIQSSLIIFGKVFPLLFGPLAIAWFVRFVTPKLQKHIDKYSFLSFYTWLLALVIVTARLVVSIKALPSSDYSDLIYLSLAALICCVVQFATGKYIGSRYDRLIAGGQALGQKNTLLAIWLTQSFLHPMVALAPSMYILWQNIINSYQIARANRKKREAQQ